MRRFHLGALLILLLCGGCLAQSSDRINVFAGFSWVSQDFSLSGPNGMMGWNASATVPVKPHVGVVADFSGHYPGYNVGCSGCGQHAKAHTFLFGPQFSVTRDRVTPFARFLVGDTYMHTVIDGLPLYVTFTSNNSFTFGGGGGVDITLSRRFAWRGQVDWLHNGFQTTDNQRRNEEIHNVARISTGLVIRF